MIRNSSGYYFTLVSILFTCIGFILGIYGSTYNLIPAWMVAEVRDRLFGTTTMMPLAACLDDLRCQSDYDYSGELNLSDKTIASIVRPTNLGQLQNRRNQLIQHIWNAASLPFDELPNTVSTIRDARWQDLANLARIDEIVVAMEHSIESRAYHFVPDQRLNKLLIYHQGHDGDIVRGKELISYYVARGVDVVAFSMPLMSRNKPKSDWINTANFGPVFLPKRLPYGILMHQYIPLLSSDDFNPAKLFFHPVVVALNHLIGQHKFEAVGMVGLSGGGWTTAILPALDSRIRYSFQIAGSLPIYLRSIRPLRDFGDYEQFGLQLYEIANYMELYLLASMGADRVHVQVLNGNDPCCFDQQAAMQYGKILPNLMDQMNVPGAFKLYMDNSHGEHTISQFSRDLIDKTFVTNKPTSPD